MLFIQGFLIIYERFKKIKYFYNHILEDKHEHLSNKKIQLLGISIVLLYPIFVILLLCCLII